MTQKIRSFLNIRDQPPYNRTSSTGNVLLLLLPVIGGGMFLLGILSPEYYKMAIWEDGIIEALSALFWLLAAAAAAATLLISRDRSKYFVLAYLGLIVFFVVCGGEEISWGQRIFGFRGPEALRAINKQHETNLHNIGSISVFANAFFVLFLTFFYYYPRKLRRGRFADFATTSNLPLLTNQVIIIATTTLAIWIVVGLRFGTLGFSPLSLWGYYTQMDDEIFEFGAAYSYFSFAMLDFQLKYAARVITHKTGPHP